MNLSGIKVMVIDDSNTIRRSAEIFLAQAGCQVVLAEDGATYLGIVCLRSDRERLCVHAGRADV